MGYHEMALREWSCPTCNATKRSKEQPICCGANMVENLTVPSVKMLEPADKDSGKSQLKDQQKLLKERARAYSRDVELHDLIQNNDPRISKQNNWINKDGVKRKAIDDK